MQVELRKLNYSECCFGDALVKSERHLPNCIHDNFHNFIIPFQEGLRRDELRRFSADEVLRQGSGQRHLHLRRAAHRGIRRRVQLLLRSEAQVSIQTRYKDTAYKEDFMNGTFHPKM